jgi:hypothetical protein
MQTATIYTLNAKVVPVEPDRSTVQMFSCDEPTMTYRIEGGEPLRIPTYETVDLPLHRVSSFSIIEPPRDLMIPGNTGNTSRTQDHLFAVEPALKEILSAPFRDEWAFKVRKLEKENLAYNNKNYELEEKLKAAEYKISHLKEHIEAVEKTGSRYVKAWNQVWRFHREPILKRLWIAFRNELTPN